MEVSRLPSTVSQNPLKITMLRETRTFRKIYPGKYSRLRLPTQKDSSRGYKRRGGPEAGRPRTIQKDSSRGYKRRGAPEAGRPRTIQKDSSRGYKHRGAPEAGRPRTIQKG